MSQSDELRRRLLRYGLDVDSLATSPVLAQFPKAIRALYVCKDTQGVVSLLGVPETEWRFSGTVFFLNGVLLLISDEVEH
jgi:hypothetical protein